LDQILPSDICKKLPVNNDRSQTHLSEDSISPLVRKCKYFMQNKVNTTCKSISYAHGL